MVCPHEGGSAEGGVCRYRAGMRTLGLIGGMSWESSAEYYRIINETVQAEMGGTHSASLLMVSFDFTEIETLQEAGDWDAAARLLCDAARKLETAGADAIVICTNTMHRMADTVQKAVQVPLLHIADGTAEAIKSAGIHRVALLGTRYTMEQDFYRGRLEDRHGLSVMIPHEPDRTTVHDIIYTELVRGVIREPSRRHYREAIVRLFDRGAEGVILGCTEIELLIGQEDSPVPVFPTTQLHATAAARFALEG